MTRTKPPDDLTLTPKQAAERLNVSVDFFRDWIQPDLKVIRIGKGQRLRTLIPVKELERWVEKQAQPQERPRPHGLWD